MSESSIVAEMRRIEDETLWTTRYFRYGFAIVAFETISGTWLYFRRDITRPEMGLLLAHLLIGVLFLLPCLMFELRRRRYREVFPGRGDEVLGVATAYALWFALLSGVYLTFTGVYGHHALWLLHVVVSLAGVAGLIAYVARTLRLFSLGAPERARAFMRRTVARISLMTSAWTLAALAASMGPVLLTKPFDARKTVPDYKPVAGSKNPFFPTGVTTASGGFIKEEALLNSRSCGVSGCHTATVRQWEDSVHYRTPNKVVSTVEKLFLSEVSHQELFDHRRALGIDALREKINGRESFRFCAGCHAPVALVSGNVNPGRPMETFQRFEGDSCIACHVVQNVKERSAGPAPYTLAAPPRYLFAYSTSALGRFAYKTLVLAKPDLHTDTFTKPFYDKSAYCMSCHNTLQYPYWKDSAWSGPSRAGGSKQCQDCHMPQVAVRDDVSAAEKGTIADHRFIATNVVIPALYGLTRQGELTRKFMTDRKVRAFVAAPSAARAGGRLHFVVQLANTDVGHIFPAGPEADLVEVWPQVTVTAGGRTLLDYGALDSLGHLDASKTVVYRISPYDFSGKPLPLDRHRSWKIASEKLRVIPPMGYDELPFDVKVPPGVAGPVEIRARLRYRKFNQSFVDWLVGAGKLKVPIVDMASSSSLVRLTRDPGAIASARAAWLDRLDRGLEGLVKEQHFDDETVVARIGFEQLLILRDAERAAKSGRLREAASLLGSLPARTRRLKGVRRLQRIVARSLARGDKTL
ncbi:MAG: hypothetical protein KGM24_10520 [Elusimicrobia bacterium]|nr:hypothetical protein [Elusimicrobiota bacterium]